MGNLRTGTPKLRPDKWFVLLAFPSIAKDPWPGRWTSHCREDWS